VAIENAFLNFSFSIFIHRVTEFREIVSAVALLDGHQEGLHLRKILLQQSPKVFQGSSVEDLLSPTVTMEK